MSEGREQAPERCHAHGRVYHPPRLGPPAAGGARRCRTGSSRSDAAEAKRAAGHARHGLGPAAPERSRSPKVLGTIQLRPPRLLLRLCPHPATNARPAAGRRCVLARALSSSPRQPPAVPFSPATSSTRPRHLARMPVVAISREETVSVAMAACDRKAMSRTIALGVNFNQNRASTGPPFAGSLRTLVGPLFGRIADVAAPPTRATDVTDTHCHWRPAGIPPKAKPRPACSTPKPLARVPTTRQPDRRGQLIMLSETTCPV